MGAIISGLLAGLVNGIFGGAGGMVLIPALERFSGAERDALFPLSVRVMFVICTVTLTISAFQGPLPWRDAVPYLLGGLAGGIASGRWGARIPTVWLHRIFGGMLLYGGVRYLWMG